MWHLTDEVMDGIEQEQQCVCQFVPITDVVTQHSCFLLQKRLLAATQRSDSQQETLRCNLVWSKFLCSLYLIRSEQSVFKCVCALRYYSPAVNHRQKFFLQLFKMCFLRTEPNRTEPDWIPLYMFRVNVNFRLNSHQLHCECAAAEQINNPDHNPDLPIRPGCSGIPFSEYCVVWKWMVVVLWTLAHLW